PVGAADPRQLVEDRRPTLGVGPADDFSGRLVIEQHARPGRCEAKPNELAIDADLIVGADLLSDLRWHAVHRDPSGDDHFFETAKRAIAALRQHLVQALWLGEDGLSGASGSILGHRARRPPQRMMLRGCRKRMPLSRG